MPRKSRLATPTRAEQFFGEMDRARRPVTTGLVEVTAWKGAARILNQTLPCAVDEPLREALAARLLTGDLRRLRLEVHSVAIWARAGAAAIFAEQIAGPIRQERRQKAAHIASLLRELAQEISREIDDADEAAEAAQEPVSRDDPDRGVVALAKRLVPLLDKYASRPPMKSDATDHAVNQFFREFAQWWEATATDPTRRGARAIRNRIAAALWIDVGGDVPPSLTAVEWTKRQLTRIGKLQA